jgi:hypothetical protein
MDEDVTLMRYVKIPLSLLFWIVIFVLVYN